MKRLITTLLLLTPVYVSANGYSYANQVYYPGYANQYYTNSWNQTSHQRVYQRPAIAYQPYTHQYYYPAPYQRRATVQYRYPDYRYGETSQPASPQKNDDKPLTTKIVVKKPLIKSVTIKTPANKIIIKKQSKQVTTSRQPAPKTKLKLEKSSGKQRFFSQILPLVNNANQQILNDRNHLLSVLHLHNQGSSISNEDKAWINKLAKRYRIKKLNLNNNDQQQELLKRVDVIAPSMALAQAANESAWGTSRFSKEGNNLFGIWTYNPKIGIKPKNREPGKKHFVRKFASFQESVNVYIHTLNSHPAYKALREIRYQATQEKRQISGLELAEGLEKYSEKGQKYIDMIQAMIRKNDLDNLHLMDLAFNKLKQKTNGGSL
jgi:Bax protein